MLSEIIQLVTSGLIVGSLYALLGVSWGIIYSTTRTFHFAHGLTFTFAAYMMIVLHVVLRLPLPLSFLLGLGLAVLFGCGVELLIYRPIRRVSPGQLGIFLAAMGTMVLGESFFQILFSPTPRSLPDFPEILLSVGPIFFTIADLSLVVAAWASIGLLELFLSGTKKGREIRAVRSNPEMATVVGISSEKTFLVVFALGSVMMGLGSFFVTIQSAATPHMGLTFVLMAFIATFLGGVGKNWGVALAGIAIGLVENLALLILPANYKHIAVFALMFAFLLIKPEGLLGGAHRAKG
jgi:Branched-chain amino acid ABC-type transport system, permease components